MCFIVVNMTLSVPEDLYKEMQLHSELRWSEVAREAFEKKVKELHFVDFLLKNSEFTEDEAEKVGHKIKHEMAKRFLR